MESVDKGDRYRNEEASRPERVRTTGGVAPGERNWTGRTRAKEAAEKVLLREGIIPQRPRPDSLQGFRYGLKPVPFRKARNLCTSVLAGLKNPLPGVKGRGVER